MRYPTLRKEAGAAKKRLEENGYKFSTCLAEPTGNPKLAKSLKIKVLSRPLHLAPASLSGYNVCPMATAGCKAACLHTAGNPVYMAAKANARNVRTKAYFEQRDDFMLRLANEIANHIDRAKRDGMRPAIRLNATSDIPWEKVPVTIDGTRYANLMDVFPGCMFYDYTKRHNRRNLPANYVLTFSLAEGNDEQAVQAHLNGMNIAAVFDTKRNRDLPPAYRIGNVSLRVIDGDEHDFRPADPQGVIVGLRAKGDAIGDTSGFVRAA